jgi:hypothetical protein
MLVFDFVAVALAAGAAVNAWLKENGLFSEWLAKIEAWGEDGPPVSSEQYAHFCRRSPARAHAAAWQRWLRHKIAYLLNCRVCLTYHAAAWLLLIFFLPSLFMPAPWSTLIKLPIYALAAARISILIGMYVETWKLSEDPEND